MEKSSQTITNIFVQSVLGILLWLLIVIPLLNSVVAYFDMNASFSKYNLESSKNKWELSYSKIPESDIRKILEKARFKEEYFSGNVLWSINFYHAEDSVKMSILGLYAPKIIPIVNLFDAYSMAPRIALNYTEKDIWELGNDLLETTTHEYIHHLLHTDIELRKKLYGTFAEYLRKFPNIQTAIQMSLNDRKRNKILYSAGIELDGTSTYDIDLWIRRMVGEVGWEAEWVKVGKDVVEYVLWGDYTVAGNTTETQLQEIFTYCTRNIMDWFVLSNELSSEQWMCSLVQSTFFNK